MWRHRYGLIQAKIDWLQPYKYLFRLRCIELISNASFIHEIFYALLNWTINFENKWIWSHIKFSVWFNLIEFFHIEITLIASLKLV